MWSPSSWEGEDTGRWLCNVFFPVWDHCWSNLTFGWCASWGAPNVPHFLTTKSEGARRRRAWLLFFFSFHHQGTEQNMSKGYSKKNIFFKARVCCLWASETFCLSGATAQEMKMSQSRLYYRRDAAWRARLLGSIHTARAGLFRCPWWTGRERITPLGGKSAQQRKKKTQRGLRVHTERETWIIHPLGQSVAAGPGDHGDRELNLQETEQQMQMWNEAACQPARPRKWPRLMFF